MAAKYCGECGGALIGKPALCNKCAGTKDGEQSYVGKIVFVEAVKDGLDAKSYSNYYGGEYFVYRQSPNFLYGCQISKTDVYGVHEQRQLPLTGAGRYAVLNSYTCDTDLRHWVTTAWYNACAIDRGEKAHWNESVYSTAKANIQAVARACGVQISSVELPMEVERALAIRVKALEEIAANLTKTIADLRTKLRTL